MKELTDRQKFILNLVIHDYVQNSQPIGSQYLVDRYNLDLSPATVRNELAALDEAGYLHQPHTSAGRMPTDEGYRYFVGRLLQDTDLPITTQRTISHQFYQSRQDVEQWMKLAVSVLAHQSHARIHYHLTASGKRANETSGIDRDPGTPGPHGDGDGWRGNSAANAQPG